MIASERRTTSWFPFWSRRNGNENGELQQKLDEANAKIAAIDHSNGVIEFSMDGVILDANQNFLSLMGYNRDEIIGKRHSMFVDPDYARSEEYRAFWNHLNQGRFHSERFQRFGKGGKEVFIQATYNPIVGPDGRPIKVVKFATDVTDQVRSEREANRLMNMVENLPTNLIFADNDLVIQYMNPASFRSINAIRHLLPISIDKVIGSPIDVFHKNPEYQRQRLSDPRNLPIKSIIKLGEETLDLEVNAIQDRHGNRIGVMTTWSVITEHDKIRKQVGSLGNVGEAVASNVRDMGHALSEISENIGRTASLAATAEEQSKHAGTTIQTLGESSREIDEVVTLIRDLAEQTNLLALNATIEAARAGEAGRGFAVVASEVKSLATGTQKATETIAQRVERIRSSISDVVDSTNVISKSIQEVSANTTQVAAGIEEQSAIVNTMGTTADELMHLSNELKKL